VTTPKRAVEHVAARTEELLPGSSGLTAATWIWLTRAGRLVEAFTREVLADDDLDGSEVTILLVLWFSGTPYHSTPGALAREAVLSQSGTARALQRAEANGTIRKSIDPHDARAVRIQLTSHGHDVVERVIEDLLRRFQERLGEPDEPSRRRIANAAALLADTLDPHRPSALGSRALSSG
jgi:DNA-binding MarR family transcriptional regulator